MFTQKKSTCQITLRHNAKKIERHSEKSLPRQLTSGHFGLGQFGTKGNTQKILLAPLLHYHNIRCSVPYISQNHLTFNSSQIFETHPFTSLLKILLTPYLMLPLFKLSPNIKSESNKCFLGITLVFLRIYVLHIILNKIRKFAITRKNSKYAPDENFWGHFCPRRKAANFCHPGLKHYCPMLNAALEWIDHMKNFVTPWIFVCVALYFFFFRFLEYCNVCTCQTS